jgi:hypothetical protein
MRLARESIFVGTSTRRSSLLLQYYEPKYSLEENEEERAVVVFIFEGNKQE